MRQAPLKLGRRHGIDNGCHVAQVFGLFMRDVEGDVGRLRQEKARSVLVDRLPKAIARLAA